MGQREIVLWERMREREKVRCAKEYEREREGGLRVGDRERATVEINFIPFSRFLLIQRFVFSVGDDDDIDDDDIDGDADDDDDAAEADSEVSFSSTLLRTLDSPRLKSFGSDFFPGQR